MRNLFHPPSLDLARDLQNAARAIETATRLSAAHARELPYAVRDLSRLLTQERNRMERPYWISPRFLTAYCRYFLPWNLVRMAHLLPGLKLSLTPGDTLLDLGSGPLTMPLALWLAYPQWRDMPLTVICNDVAPNPMQVGRDIFRELAGEKSPWRIELRRGPLDAALRGLKNKAALITAGNVLNEIPAGRESSLEQRLADLAGQIAGRLTPEGRLLAVEPGNRLGGKLIALLRRGGLAAGLSPLCPCPHQGPCPMLTPSMPGKRPTGWCHFSHPVAAAGEDAAPKSLLELTRKAKLEKEAFSLSCLLLQAAPDTPHAANPARDFADIAPDLYDDEGDWDDGGEDGDDWNGPDADFYHAPEGGWPKTAVARILSDPIRLPDRGVARYACTERGLALVVNALRIPSGATLQIRWPERDERDLKTGALTVTLPAPAVKKTVPARPEAEKRARPKSPQSGVKPATQPRPAAPPFTRRGHGKKNP